MTDILRFTHIPKTAGSSIYIKARENGIKWGPEDPELANIHFHHQLTGHNALQFMHEEKLKKYIEKYRTFTVVRNPYHRMVSFMLWTDKGLKHKSAKYFSQRVEHHVRCYKGKNNHWAPQVIWVNDKQGNPIINHVLKFENLTSEFNALMQEYNIDIQLDKHLNQSSHVHTVRDLEDSCIALINEVYAEDFKAFNYPICTTASEIPEY